MRGSLPASRRFNTSPGADKVVGRSRSGPTAAISTRRRDVAGSLKPGLVLLNGRRMGGAVKKVAGTAAKKKRRAMTAALRIVCAAGLSAALATTNIAAQGKRVAASDSWVKLPAGGEKQAMAFVAIDNPTMYGIYVTSATSAAAGRVELRDSSLSGDARLKPVEFINVPAYDSINMKPDGVHLLLLDLNRPLKEGDRVPLTLSTDNAGNLEVAALVRKE